MFFASIDTLLGGALFGSVSTRLPFYPSPRPVVVPVAGAAVSVFERGTTVQVDCFAAADGSGSPAAQPFITDADGHVVDGSGNVLHTVQPGLLDVVVSGGGLPAPRTIAAGWDFGTGSGPSAGFTGGVSMVLGG